MEPNHKFEPNRKYYTICIYTVITVLISVILVKAVWYWASTIEAFNQLLNMLMPFLLGFFIAYLMNPLIRWLDKKVLEKLFHIKYTKLRKALSILFSYVIVIGIIVICISIIIPEIYASIINISSGVQTSYDRLIVFLEKTNEKHPDWDISYITDLFKDNSANIISFVNGSLNKILPLLYNTSVSVVSWLLKILIAIIVSCYLIIDKDRMLKNTKKTLYAFVKKNIADTITSTFHECNRIFGGFIIGKTIDSTIIGIMCFAFMNILDLEYTMLISIIIGITNMIPYFGPFIGAVPGILISLTVSWQHALIFGILIFALQQFDGLYLGPKILGDSTGLRPVWIIFAITAGGWLAGVIGMFLGVPVVAVIAYLTEQSVNRCLEKKQIDPDSL